MTEKRIDPSDSCAYTFDELVEFYRGKYKKKAVEAYWQECTPVKKRKPRKAKGQEPAKKEEGKTKETAKTTEAPKPKAKAATKPLRVRNLGPADPKRFINDEALIVQDCIDGLIWSTPNLARLDAYPDIKVVFRTDWSKDKVAIISGGGAGHEPMHGGFVGKGMLTAAVSGETFASPTIDAVLAAIVQVTGPKGCLLVIKNYTGDRLNFSLAAQQAKAKYGLEVETVFTRDDVATVAERGIAGTLFVHKVAGALAEAGKSLAEVKAVAQAVIDSTASMGISFSSVRRLKTEMINIKNMEVGLGIHGEPGSRVEPVASATKVVEAIMEGIMAGTRMTAEASHGYACLVNNLGSVPPQEMCIIVAALMKSKWADSIKLLVGPGSLCTSLDMNGVSLSLLRLTPQIESLLKADTAVAAWPTAVVPHFPEPVKGISCKDPFDGVVASTDDVVGAALERSCKALVDAKATLDELDSKVGDADCGTTMAAAATMVLQAKDKLPLADPAATCSCLGAMCSKAMGGSSGVLLSIMFFRMASHFEKSSSKSWAAGGPAAFTAGLEAMMQAGGAGKGSRTMLDALVPAAEALVAGEGLAGAKTKAEEGADATKDMAPKAGRTENVPEAVWKGVEDPGAKAAALFFAALSS